jgi:uncharacterized protein (DUF433 family)
VGESRRRLVTERPRITLDPNVMVGKPVIRGTRIIVELIVGLLEEGWSKPDILAAYLPARTSWHAWPTLIIW